jgi:hypothetical protein
MTGRNWERVSRLRPCPVCGKPDWCVHVEGGTICPRTPEGSVRDLGSAGYLHVHGERDRRRHLWLRTAPEQAPDVGDLADLHYLATNAASARIALAARIGVGSDALDRLRVGWNAAVGAWTFPMRDGRGRIVGIQQRFKATDDKRVVRGLRSGVFEPFQVDVRGSELVVCEGASDVAAALSVGLEAIGRFSCSGTIEETVDRIRRHQPGRVIVVPDNDEPGLRGAEQLIRRLDGIARVELRRPPHGIKDLRAWTQAGATAGDITKGAA